MVWMHNHWHTNLRYARVLGELMKSDRADADAALLETMTYFAQASFFTVHELDAIRPDFDLHVKLADLRDRLADGDKYILSRNHFDSYAIGELRFTPKVSVHGDGKVEYKQNVSGDREHLSQYIKHILQNIPKDAFVHGCAWSKDCSAITNDEQCWSSFGTTVRLSIESSSRLVDIDCYTEYTTRDKYRITWSVYGDSEACQNRSEMFQGSETEEVTTFTDKMLYLEWLDTHLSHRNVL
jgi:hypothetical protein